MPRLRWALLAFLLLGGLGLKIQADLTPERNDVALALDDPPIAGLRIAVLSDLSPSGGPGSSCAYGEASRGGERGKA